LKKLEQQIRLAVQYCQQGNLHQAESVCKENLKKHPDNLLLLNLMGVIQYQLGNYSSATEYLTKALKNAPANADVHYNLGNVSKDTGLFDEAIAHYQKSIQLNPNLFEAYHNLGMIYQDLHNSVEAENCYQKALKLNPNVPDTYYNLATIFHDGGDLDKAITYYQEALQRDPNFIDAHYNLANALREKKMYDKAIVHYRHALQLNPNMFDALYNMGTVYQEKGQLEIALDSFEKALQLNPLLPEAYNSMGIILQKKDQIDRALDLYRRAVDLRPEFVEAIVNIGNALRDYRLSEEAEYWYRNALSLKPDCTYCYDNLFFLMLYHPRYDPQLIFSEHRAFANRCADFLSFHSIPHFSNASPNRRIKIGHISPDFRQHSVAFFLEPVLAGHNRDKVEVYCYSDVPTEDEVTQRMKGYADHWQSIVSLSDEQVADLIRNDGIDILVDLAGHTAHNRLLVFARKPAPVQVSWIGYPATTGLSAMDYKIVDNYTDPPGMTEHLYTEKLIRMPESFLCYLPAKDSPEVGPLPALTAGHITFGSFNNFPKVTPEMMELWSDILKAVPGSRLVMKAKSLSDISTREYVTETFKQKGIPAERIELLEWEPSSRGHLEIYNRIDIALDTFPYHGTTTTCEALWMGVPVITLAGATHASRVGVSLLSNAGVPELVAQTPDEYRKKASNLTADADRLMSLRRDLRSMMQQSPLTNVQRFLQSLENTYRDIWKQWGKTV